MQQFTYRAKDEKGVNISAQVEAGSVGDAAKLLIARKLFPLSIEPYKANIFNGGSLEKLQRVTSKDKVLFTRQLATLVKAGLPLGRALTILRDQTNNPKLQKVVVEISGSIEGGSSLSDALKKYPKYFNNIYISMVQAGEASGSLDDTLTQLAAQEEKTAAVNSKIRGAFTYPIVVLSVLIIVAVLMITLVLPQVGKMYTDLKKPLPFLTAILLGTANLMITYWYVAILLLIGLIVGGGVYLRSQSGRRKLDTTKLNLPLFGPLIRKLYMARLARTLGSLIASGVSVQEALLISSRSMNNVLLEEALLKITDKVKSGTALSTLVGDNPLFLPLVGQMLAVGEETGTIGDSLNKLAQYYEDEVDEAVNNISTLIEPATMVVLGGMVAFLIAAVLLPIYGLVSVVGN
ncbi:MAG: type II secretion system F family protein [Candidatus Saccharimonadia bacterium]